MLFPLNVGFAKPKAVIVLLVAVMCILSVETRMMTAENTIPCIKQSENFSCLSSKQRTYDDGRNLEMRSQIHCHVMDMEKSRRTEFSRMNKADSPTTLVTMRAMSHAEYIAASQS